MKSSRYLLLTTLSTCLILQGCTSVKKTLGIERDPPDEFSVTPSMQPLDMPPDFFVLPEPCPGAPRPQDTKALQSKKEKLLGAPLKTGQITPGQSALLEKAGANPGQENIRAQIDSESRIESSKDKNILQQLGLQKNKPAGETINAYEEARKLQEEGVRPTTTSQN